VSLDKNKQQWAFRGKPLYYRVNDTPIDKPFEFQDFDPTDPWFTIGIPLQSSAKDGMQLALIEPQHWMKMPFNMSAGEYRNAPGMVLIGGVTGNNPMGRPLYTFSGTAEEEKQLSDIFKPEYAAALDLPMNDFTIRERLDGTRQWIQGRSFTPAVAISVRAISMVWVRPGNSARYAGELLLPPQVIKKDPAIGRMVEASTGMTLYYRDRMTMTTHRIMRGQVGTMSPTVGSRWPLNIVTRNARRSGILSAPNDAQPHGYWSVYVRKDGARQWAYKSNALYTHANEQPVSTVMRPTPSISTTDMVARLDRRSSDWVWLGVPWSRNQICVQEFRCVNI
jgi:predicted lipoprotein with Yx(FWY)xxD motif